MELCNILTGIGCGDMGDRILLFLGIGIVFFVSLILKGQSEDGFLSGVGFNFPAGLGAGLVLAFLISALTASPIWTLISGLIGLAAGGLGTGFLGGGSD